MTGLQRAEVRLKGGDTVVVDWLPPSNGRNVAVFIHGLGSNRRGEKALHFSEGFADLGWGFLSVDLRGHGESTGSLEDLTLSRCLEDVEVALSLLPPGANPSVFIGSSMGGSVAAWHVLLRPNPAQRLVLIAPAMRFPAYFAELPPQELAVWRQTGRRRLASEWIDLQLGYGIVEDAARYPREQLLREHRVPTLILHGMQDTAVPWQESVAFSELTQASDVELVLIKNGDHRLTAQKVYLFDLIRAWLGRRGL